MYMIFNKKLEESAINSPSNFLCSSIYVYYRHLQSTTKEIMLYNGYITIIDIVENNKALSNTKATFCSLLNILVASLFIFWHTTLKHISMRQVSVACLLKIWTTWSIKIIHRID